MINIYTLSHPETKEVRYVGLTRDPKKRLRQYRYKGHTAHLNNWLKSLPDDPKLSIIAKVEEEFADQAERFWIAAYKLTGTRLINFTSGGEKGCSPSLEVRQRSSERQKGRKGPKQSKETIEKRRRKLIGRIASPGSSERFTQLNLSRTGIPLSEEHRAKLKALWTPERRKQFSERTKSQWLSGKFQKDGGTQSSITSNK